MIGKTKRYTLCAFRKINVGSLCIIIDVDMLTSCTIFQGCRHFVVVSIYIFLISQKFHSSGDYYQDLTNHIRLLLKISYDLSLTAAICKLKPFLSSSNSSFNFSTVFLADFEFQCPGIVIENELFSLVILKTEFVHSNELTAKSHLPSSTKFIGGLNEKVCNG